MQTLSPLLIEPCAPDDSRFPEWAAAAARAMSPNASVAGVGREELLRLGFAFIDSQQTPSPNLGTPPAGVAGLMTTTAALLVLTHTMLAARSNKRRRQPDADGTSPVRGRCNKRTTTGRYCMNSKRCRIDHQWTAATLAGDNHRGNQPESVPMEALRGIANTGLNRPSGSQDLDAFVPDAVEIAETLYAVTKMGEAEGGFTLAPQDLNLENAPQTGFAVTLNNTPLEWKPEERNGVEAFASDGTPTAEFVAQIATWAEAFADAWAMGAWIGAWHNPESKCWELNVTMLCDEDKLEHATYLGINQDQIAICDLRKAAIPEEAKTDGHLVLTGGSGKGRWRGNPSR